MPFGCVSNHVVWCFSKRFARLIKVGVRYFITIQRVLFQTHFQLVAAGSYLSDETSSAEEGSGVDLDSSGIYLDSVSVTQDSEESDWEETDDMSRIEASNLRCPVSTAVLHLLVSNFTQSPSVQTEFYLCHR